tara:strand:- start:606 stop:989 length:384 start_codon:yes stop_codon:yes gene_type:complete
MSTECCVVCAKPVPEEYLLGKKSDWWVECTCSAHTGWYCDKHSPTNECFDDEECDCCNPAEEDEDLNECEVCDTKTKTTIKTYGCMDMSVCKNCDEDDEEDDPNAYCEEQWEIEEEVEGETILLKKK